MSTQNHRIVIKHSDVAGAYPEISDLVPGELAINTTDNKLFYRGSSNNLVIKDLDFDTENLISNIESLTNSGLIQTVNVDSNSGMLTIVYRDGNSIQYGSIKGPKGDGISINGAVDWADELPYPASAGGGVSSPLLPEVLNKTGTIFSVLLGEDSSTPLVTFDSPELYLYDANAVSWTNLGALQGPAGPAGPASNIGTVNSATTSNGTALLNISNVKFTDANLTTTPAPGGSSAAGRILTIASSGFLTSESRSGIDSRTSFPPSSHTHGNITTDGKITVTAVSAVESDSVVITQADGTITRTGRSGIDSRTSFTPSSHTHGNITNDGKITAAAVTVTANDSVVITQADGTITRTSRNGIDTRTVFPASTHTHGNIANDGTISSPIIQSGFVGPGDSVLISSPLAFPANQIVRASREGIDSRTSFPPSSHSHGNINNNGTIGNNTSSDLVVTTTTGGALTVSNRSGIDSRTSFPPSSHSHGNITADGKITAAAVAVTINDRVVITQSDGTLQRVIRSGIDSRTDFPNSDVSLATSSATPGRLARRDSSGNCSFNQVNSNISQTYSVSLITGHDAFAPGTPPNERPEYTIVHNHESLELVNSSGGLGIITVHPDVLPSPRTNLERRRLYKTPNANGIFALTSQDDGTIGINDVVDLEDELAKSIRPTDVSSLRKAANISVELWEKGAKAITTSADNLTMYAASSTGYIKVLSKDASLMIYGSGISGENITIATSGADGNNRLPKFFAVFPCDSGGNITGNLTYLDCSNSMLTCLDVSTLSNLVTLNCNDNDLTYIYLPKTENTSSLVTLYCSGNRLTRLKTKNMPNLTNFDCSYNLIKSLDFSQNSQLLNLYCSHNNITSLFVQGCNSLSYINCSYNNLAVLDVSNLPSLTTLYCQYNSLTEVSSASLNLDGCTSLTILNCSYNAMVGAAFNLDGLGLTACQTIDASNNSIELALVTDLDSLTSLDLSSNLLQTSAMNDLFVSLWNHPLIIDGYNEYPVATLWYGYNPAVTNPDPDPVLDVNLAPDSWTLIPYSPEDD